MPRMTRVAWFILLAPLAGGSFASGLLVTALPLFLATQGVSLGYLAALYGLVALCAAAVSLQAGRHSRALARPLPLLTLLGIQAASFPMYLLVRGPYTLLLVSLVGSIAGAAAGPSVQTLIADSTGGKMRAVAYARHGLVVSISYGTALLAASLLLRFGFAPVFMLASAIASITWVVAAAVFLKRRASRSHPQMEELAKDCMKLMHSISRLGSAVRHARRAPVTRTSPSRRNSRRVALHIFFFYLGLGAYPVLFPIFLLSMDVALHWIGFVVAGSWFIFAASQSLGARLGNRFGGPRGVVLLSLLAASGLNIGIAMAPLWGIIASWLVLGFADGIGRPLTNQWLTYCVAAEDRGRAFGQKMAAATLSRAFGPLVLAGIVLWQGFPLAFLVTALLVLVSMLPLSRLQDLSGSEVIASRTPAGGEPA